MAASNAWLYARIEDVRDYQIPTAVAIVILSSSCSLSPAVVIPGALVIGLVFILAFISLSSQSSYPPTQQAVARSGGAGCWVMLY